MMLSPEQLASIKALVQKALSYTRILKAQRGRRFDESKVHRVPAGAPGGHGGEFGRSAGGRSQMDLGSGGGPFVRAQRAYEEGGTGAAKERIREGLTAVQPGMERGASHLPYSKRRRQGFSADVLNYQQRQEQVQQRGKGFMNRPRAGEGIPEPQPETANIDIKVLTALREGTVTDSSPLGDGSNANASVRVTLDDGTEAVYKPERGENWHASFTNHDITRFVTNKDFSLAARETFASEVDQALGLGVVPLTVLREQVDETNINVNTEGDDDGGGGGYDSYEAREQYDEYKQNFFENPPDSAYNEADEKFMEKFAEAKDEHVSDLESRREEIQEIWDDLRKDYPEGQTDYGSQSMLRQHPALPMGSVEGFERRDKRVAGSDVIDPIELFDDVGADVSAKLNREEKDNIRAALKARLDEGYRELGEIEEEAAKDHLDFDKWREEHEDTEIQIRDEVMGSKLQSFTEWRQSHGYQSGGGYGGGSGEDRNPDAPHPSGGSFQQFRAGDHYGDVTDEQGAKLAVLDYVIGTMDRHGHNIMFDDDGLIAIDNGYSMPDLPDNRQPDKFTFRSEAVGEWLGNNGGHIPSDVRESLHDTMQKTDWQALLDRHPNMTAGEKKAFLGRVENMKIALQTQEGLRELWGRLRVM